MTFMHSTRSKMLLAATMVAVGGVGLGIGLHTVWPVIVAALFVTAQLGLVRWG